MAPVTRSAAAASSSAARGGRADAPEPVWLALARALDARGLAALALVCRRWRDAVRRVWETDGFVFRAFDEDTDELEEDDGGNCPCARAFRRFVAARAWRVASARLKRVSAPAWTGASVFRSGEFGLTCAEAADIARSCPQLAELDVCVRATTAAGARSLVSHLASPAGAALLFNFVCTSNSSAAALLRDATLARSAASVVFHDFMVDDALMNELRAELTRPGCAIKSVEFYINWRMREQLGQRFANFIAHALPKFRSSRCLLRNASRQRYTQVRFVLAKSSFYVVARSAAQHIYRFIQHKQPRLVFHEFDFRCSRRTSASEKSFCKQHFRMQYRRKPSHRCISLRVCIVQQQHHDSPGARPYRQHTSFSILMSTKKTLRRN